MDAAARHEAIQRARSLEEQGRSDAAVQAYVEAGAVEDAARVLAGRQRFGEAGDLLLSSLGIDASRPAGLDPVKGKQALMAGIYLARAGRTQEAVDLFLALGERPRAIETLERAGDRLGAALLERSSQPLASAETSQRLESAGHDDLALTTYVQNRQYDQAARLARRLGRLLAAGELYAVAGRPFEAATCYLEAGEAALGLERLAELGPDHPRYREACALAVGCAAELKTVGIELEQLLGSFIRSGPQTDEERETFCVLARLYESQGFLENAKEALGKVVNSAPSYGDAAVRLAALEKQTHARPAARDLPGLPPLPALPEPLPLLSREPWATPSREERPIPADRFVKQAPVFSVGATIDGRYRLNEKIGQGGMSVVFRASDLELGEEIALKVFSQTGYDEDEARFKHEVKLSRQLSHPNIVRLFDIGRCAGFHYISMELLVGIDLMKRLASALPMGEALSYLMQISFALQAAHDQGIVHRDLKPANIFITGTGLVKVMDFGIAKVLSAPGVTSSGVIAGTPAYMSPEQITNFRGVTAASDLYSLGAIAYEMFTGTVPFQNSEVMPLLLMHLNEMPLPPRSRNPAIPEQLDSLILRLLAKTPGERFRSARELSEELESIHETYLRGTGRPA